MAARKTLRWCLVLIWLILTVYLSCQHGPESSELSHKIAAGSYALLKKVFPKISLSSYHTIIREVAHFAVHFVLALLAYRAIAPCCKDFKAGIVVSLLFCLLIAAIDELIQCCSPGRTMEFIDFFHNSSGVSFGTIVGILSNDETAY